MLRRRTLVVASLSAALFALPAGPASADCATLNIDVTAALNDRAVDRFASLYEAVRVDTTCDPDYRAQIGRLMARVTLTGLPTDATPDRIEALTEYGRPWQILVALGDAYYDLQDYSRAVPIYEEALDDMRDVAANPSAPPEDVERRTYQRAVQARALAPTFIATRQFRGARTGLADPNFRTFTAVATPVPVQFETGLASLTPQGIAAVTDISAYLKQTPHQRLVIIGHTDPRGSEAYNLDLSARRAQTVAAYLAQLGYTGAVEISPRGESQPFVADDPAKYTEDQIYAFDRRVEYQLIY